MTYVHVDAEVYGPDDEIPPEIAARITNPKAWGETEAPAAEVTPTSAPADADPVEEVPVEEASDDPAPPPHGGPGSGKAAWRDYAASLGVEVEDGAERSEIIDALKSAGKRTE